MNAVCVDYEAIETDNTVDVNKGKQITLSTAIEVPVNTIHQFPSAAKPFDKILN